MGKLDFYDRGPDRPWPNPQLTSAAIVGHTTATSARLWIRMWAEGTYWLIVSKEPIPADGVRMVKPRSGAATIHLETGDGQVTTLKGRLLSRRLTFDSDLTGVFDVDGLEPGALYHYAVITEEPRKNPWELPPDVLHRCFSTQPHAEEEIRFGLVSCHMPYKANGDVINMQMWERLGEEMRERQAQFLIGAGDQVYTDGNNRVSIWRYLKNVKDDLLDKPDDEQVAIMRSWFRDIYRGYWGFPQLRNVLSRFPTYHIWDDHEIMDGWGSYTTDELANRLDTMWEWQNSRQNLALADRMFEAAKATYIEYQHSHNPDVPTFDYSFTWGAFAFYVLDMRGQRDFNRRGSHKILGKSQMDRLFAWLKSDEAMGSPALFIVSPVPVVHVNSFIVNKLDIPLLGLADDLRDEWDHESNWKERDRMLDAVFDHADAAGKIVAFLSGDVHMGGAFRLSRKNRPRASVFQLTSSGITYPASPLLKFAVKERGTLAHEEDAPEKRLTVFNKIHIMTRNNFGIISATPGAGPSPASVSWDLYGSTGEQDEIVRLKRILLA